MSDLVRRLNATLRTDAINGDSFERGIVESQIAEAVRYIEELERQVARQAISTEEGGWDAKFAEFGRALVAMCYELADGWWGDEWSEDVMPLAVEAGLARRTPYDPEEHGEGLEAEPGDEIWYWNVPRSALPTPPQQQGRADGISLSEQRDRLIYGEKSAKDVE